MHGLFNKSWWSKKKSIRPVSQSEMLYTNIFFVWTVCLYVYCSSKKVGCMDVFLFIRFIDKQDGVEICVLNVNL